VFYYDGTCTFSGKNGKWEIKDELLVIKLAKGYLTSPQDIFSYVFSNGDRTLTITDINSEATIVFIKQ